MLYKAFSQVHSHTRSTATSECDKYEDELYLQTKQIPINTKTILQASNKISLQYIKNTTVAIVHLGPAKIYIQSKKQNTITIY